MSGQSCCIIRCAEKHGSPSSNKRITISVGTPLQTRLPKVADPRVERDIPCACVRTGVRPQRHRSQPDQATTPWTTVQVERLNRTLKGAAVKRYYFDTHDQLRSHLAKFAVA
jgi:hypothetical protein